MWKPRAGRHQGERLSHERSTCDGSAIRGFARQWARTPQPNDEHIGSVHPCFMCGKPSLYRKYVKPGQQSYVCKEHADRIR